MSTDLRHADRPGTTPAPGGTDTTDASQGTDGTGAATSRRGPRRPRPRLPQPRPASPRDEPRLVLSSVMAMVGLVCLWLVLQLLVLGAVAQSRSQTLLYDEFRTQVASATAPVGPVTPVGDPVAVLSIPALGLEQTVVEGTASGTTLEGPGHLRNTVLPGQVGTSVVMGRAQTYGGPFGDLARLRPGDPIQVASAQGTTTYEVIGVRRAGDEVPQPLASGSARLVLITAEGGSGLSALSAGSVLYVDADATEAFPAPAGLPAVVPEPELPLQGDPGVLPLLVLDLAALLAVALGVVWARQRHRAALVWVVAAPLALAVTWSTTTSLMHLLPNLL